MRGLTAVSLLLATVAAEGPTGTTAETILEFARSKLGMTVGDGQCSSLVAAALDHAGVARPRGQGGWGEPLDSLDEVRPGDILRFDDARFAGRRVNPNRTVTKWSYHFPDHVAIVDEVAERRGTRLFRIIHQNVRIAGRDASDAVKVWTLDMATFQSGSIRAYRVTSPTTTQDGAATGPDGSQGDRDESSAIPGR